MNDVTIVVATYNRPEMLEVELHSILASAAMVPTTRARILVVDDCSETMAARLIAKRLGIDYLRLTENRGVAGALSAGYELVDSEFYALWGDDDYMLPRWFPLHLEEIAKGWDVVAGSYWLTDADLRPVSEVTLPPTTLAQLRKGNVLCNDGSLVRRSALDGIAFRPERERAMMMTLWLALASEGRRFTSIAEPSWLYRRHAGNLSNHFTKHDVELRRQAIAEYAA